MRFECTGRMAERVDVQLIVGEAVIGMPPRKDLILRIQDGDRHVSVMVHVDAQLAADLVALAAAVKG